VVEDWHTFPNPFDPAYRIPLAGALVATRRCRGRESLWPHPADLLLTVRSGKGMGNPRASRNVSARMKAKLRAKLPD
jgi:hypothetical protein